MSDVVAQCSRTASLSAQRRGDLSAEQVAHASGCAACAAEVDAIDEMIGIARTLGAAEPDPGRSERLRMRLLDSARRRPPRPVASAWRAGLMIAAAAAVLLVGVGSVSRLFDDASAPVASEGARLRGTVRASAGAQFTRLSDAPDEIVRLIDGGITVSVTPLAATERFRVVVGDAEVEVRGTVFEVLADHDHLADVRVLHGTVEVRVAGDEPVRVSAGEHWSRSVERVEAPAEEALVIDEALRDATSPSPSVREPRATPTRHPVESLHAEPAPEPASAAASFETGWSELHRGEPASAANAFGEVLGNWPGDPLAEDASFWHAVALSRAGSADAGDALERFLTDHARSAHAGTAAVMLGWLLVERGDRDGARERFTSALADGNERVRASAQRGLTALGESAIGDHAVRSPTHAER